MKTADALLNPAPDFSTPLELLHACHGRIEKQCDTLLKLPGHLAAHGVDDQAIQAAAAILKYFTTAARHHHEDEEQDLFPMVRRHAESNANARMVALLDTLALQHRDMEAAWGRMQPWLESLAQGEVTAFASTDIEGFVALYQAHIAQEESALLPYARAALGAEQLTLLGDRMAARRGVKLDGERLV